MPRTPKPKPGELHAVDDYFELPKPPPLRTAPKRELLAWMDRLIAALDFWLESLAEADVPPEAEKYIAHQASYWWERRRTLDWLHRVIEQSKHPDERVPDPSEDRG